MGTFDSIYQQKILQLEEENKNLKNIIHGSLYEMAQTSERANQLDAQIAKFQSVMRNHDIHPESDHPYAHHLKSLQNLRYGEVNDPSRLYGRGGEVIGTFKPTDDAPIREIGNVSYEGDAARKYVEAARERLDVTHKGVRDAERVAGTRPSDSIFSGDYHQGPAIDSTRFRYLGRGNVLQNPPPKFVPKR